MGKVYQKPDLHSATGYCNTDPEVNTVCNTYVCEGIMNMKKRVGI
jgi:hypothetical protein